MCNPDLIAYKTEAGNLIKTETGLTWRIMAENRCAVFYTWIYDFDRMSDPFEKKSSDSQHDFLFVDFFSFTCVYYDTRYGQKT